MCRNKQSSASHPFLLQQSGPVGPSTITLVISLMSMMLLLLLVLMLLMSSILTKVPMVFMLALRMLQIIIMASNDD